MINGNRYLSISIDIWNCHTMNKNNLCVTERPPEVNTGMIAGVNGLID